MTSQTVERYKTDLQEDKEKARLHLAGLQAFSTQPVSEDAKNLLTEHMSRLRARMGLIDNIVVAIDALLADGYPEMDMSGSAELYAEMEKLHEAQGEALEAMAPDGKKKSSAASAPKDDGKDTPTGPGARRS